MAIEEASLRQSLLDGMAGDAPAYRRFLEDASALLRGYYRRRLAGDPTEAEDLVQETLLAIHTRRDSYDPAYPLTAWIHAIARYRLIDHWRRRRRRGVSIPVEDATALFEPSVADAVDASTDIEALLTRLPPKQREAIRLVKLEEKSVRDAAAQTGWSESDIKVSIHRGLKTLARMMREEG